MPRQISLIGSLDSLVEDIVPTEHHPLPERPVGFALRVKTLKQMLRHPEKSPVCVDEDGPGVGLGGSQDDISNPVPRLIFLDAWEGDFLAAPKSVGNVTSTDNP